MEPGAVVRNRKGRFTIGEFVASGGEAEVYRAKDESGGDHVIKVYHGRCVSKALRHRTRLLVDLEPALTAACSALVLPHSVAEVAGAFGSLARYIPGQPLDRALESAMPLENSVVHAIVLAHLHDVLHQHELACGDIAASNYIVHGLSLAAVDLGNAVHLRGKAPPPPCAGQDLYMAPEVRKALAEGRPAPVGEEADRFSLTCLLSEMLLRKHPADGVPMDDFDRAMASGVWPFEPGHEADRRSAGPPAETLTPAMLALFRRGFALVPGDRPTPSEWRQTLFQAYQERMFVHRSCGKPFFSDESRQRCPHCGGTLAFAIAYARPNGIARLRIDRPGRRVGRANLPSPEVSAEHGAFTYAGNQLFFASSGRNGSFRRVDGAWIRLPDGLRVQVKAGDRLRLASYEVVIEES